MEINVIQSSLSRAIGILAQRENLSSTRAPRSPLLTEIESILHAHRETRTVRARARERTSFTFTFIGFCQYRSTG